MANLKNSKLDPRLSLALEMPAADRASPSDTMTGYSPEQTAWKLIVKYAGDIEAICDKYSASCIVLSDKYAIVCIQENRIAQLSAEKEINYIEKPKRLSYQLNYSTREACVSPVRQ